MSFWENFFYLLCAHALTDYALQSDTMALCKHPDSDHEPRLGPWWWHMAAHSFVNGLGVAVVTQSSVLGMGESVIHFLADTAKCRRFIGTWTDQLIHLTSKVVFAWIM